MHESQSLVILPSKYPQSFEMKLEELQMRLNSTKNESLVQTWLQGRFGDEVDETDFI